MDTEILRELINCSLTEEEQTPVVLCEEDLMDGVVECEANVYIKIHALKLGFISIQGFSLAMTWDWNCNEGEEDPVNGEFDECKFWIQVLGLKEEYYTNELAGKLALSFVGCQMVELRRDKGGKKFFRVRAVLKVNQPIRWLVNFKVGRIKGAGIGMAEEVHPSLSIEWEEEGGPHAVVADGDIREAVSPIFPAGF
ncbi:hypothetical protein LIER_22490 [Lithospermum erythrorhizon]|uniref:DUF4283 domain-containing protein n=1 Tax=Lithospermum erythrorhizon TaxID=34254 RepID=A0AAV3QXI9_LITER